MFKLSRVRIILLGPGIALLFLLVVVMTAVYASNISPVQENDLEIDLLNDLEDTSLLTVTILSSPWAIVDSNKPGEEGPEVFVVEAAISNTSDITLTNLEVELDYDPGAGWALLDDEDPLRILTSLGPQETYYAYWFTRYPAVVGVSHQYTVTADATGTDPASTSDNFYFNPDPGKTVKTASYLNTGNSSIFEPDIEVVVGGIFTANVTYDLGNNPEGVGFSPAGNVDFKPSSAQLLATKVHFYGSGITEPISIDNRLYFDELPLINGTTVPTTAEVSYVFLPLKLDTIEMCPYAAVYFSVRDKYDKDYCDIGAGTIIIIGFDVSMTMTKQASTPEILQNETLTYTLHYSNEGELALSYGWLWDVVDTNVVSILTETVSPPSNPAWSTDSLLAWYIGDVPAAGQPGSSGSMNFTVVADGNGQDLPDGTQLVNNAFFGIDPGGLPSEATLTTTVTTTVQAPSIELTKSDGLVTTNPGDQLTYTLNAVNNGSVDAYNVVISDVLPLGVSYVPDTAGETELIGRTLGWELTGTISANGGSVNIDVPVTVNWDLLDGTVLTNLVSIDFKNKVGYEYETMTATDTTTVESPALAIAKADFPDPVLSGNPLTYTLTYTNNGFGSATNVVITDVVPLSTTYTSCAGGDTCLLDGDTVTWELSAITAGSSGSVAFTVMVSPTLANGTVLMNDDYGLTSDETGFIAGGPETTIVFRNAGYVEGYAFVDEDGNGEMDPGEAGIINVTVSLPDATVPNTITDIDGYYLFRVEQENWVSVSAGLPAGYFRTSPGSLWVYNQLNITKTIDFGYAPLTATFGSVYGTVFEDLDGDGKQEFGEGGLAGVLVTLDGVVTATTDAYGSYSFTTTVTGTHRVTESDPDGYVSTTPNDVAVYVETGSGREVNFGDILEGSASFSSIVGTVFNDLDADGEWDLNEPGIEDVTLTLDGLVTSTTDINGSYAITTTATGIHTVIETDPDGYRSTTPNQVNAVVVMGNSYVVNFGDTTFAGAANIFGTVFEDTDGNGQWDAGEIGIPDVLVTLSGSVTDTTDAYGSYGFMVNQSGVYPVVETDKVDYFSTTPNDVHVAVSLGESYLVDFGDAKSSSNFAAIVGTVFEDLNSDGLWDADEVGLTNVAINLNDETQQTGSYGSYSFMTTVVGSHTVVEEDPAGYFSTTPNTVTLTDVSLGQGYRVDFGDVPAELATCPDDSFEKDDDLDQANMLDSSGVQDHDFCKDPIDWVWFDAAAGYEYTISTSSWGQRADTVVTLFDQNERRLAANDDEANSGDFSSDLVWRATYSGRHYVRVTNRANLTGFHTDYKLSLSVQEDYLLYLPVLVLNSVTNSRSMLSKPAAQDTESANLTVGPAGVIAHSCPDGNEIDDTWRLAKPVAPGVEQIHSFDSNPYLNAADKDFLWFNVNSLDVYTFTLTSVTNTSAVMELYNSQGNVLEAKDDQQLVWSGQDGALGRYYLSVSPAPGFMNYGCPSPPEQSGDPDQVGYTLLAEVDLGSTLYLPVIVKSGD